MGSYPLLDFFSRHGRAIAVILGCVTLLFGAWCGYRDSSWIWGLAGLCTALVVFGFVASYAELVRLITDMLLPK